MARCQAGLRDDTSGHRELRATWRELVTCNERKGLTANLQRLQVAQRAVHRLAAGPEIMCIAAQTCQLGEHAKRTATPLRIEMASVPALCPPLSSAADPILCAMQQRHIVCSSCNWL